jgi:hypothetical protein
MKLPKLIAGLYHPGCPAGPLNRRQRGPQRRHFVNRGLLGRKSKRAYQINSSLLFRGAQYLSRTPSVAGNRKTFTISMWVRRGALGATQSIAQAAVGGSEDRISFNSDDTLWVAFNGATYYVKTTRVFRDVGAPYHIVVSVDTTQATASNRIKLYVNGVQETAFSATNYMAQNYDCGWNNTALQEIGRAAGAQYLNGSIAEPIIVDGAALTPSSFGEIDPVTLNWRPKRVSGITWGTNGAYLGQGGWTFASLGANAANPAQPWTATGFASTDVLADSPTNIYATLSPLNNFGNVTGGGTFSEGNLRYAMASAGYSGPMASLDATIISTPYWEVTYKAGGQYATFGAANELFVQGTNGDVGAQANGWGVIPGFGLYHGGVRIVALGSVVADDVFMFAYKASTKGLYIGFKGQWFNSSGVLGAWNEAAPTYTVTGNQLFPTTRAGNGADMVFNFGQRAFAYTPPTGFKTLCTSNLPATTGATSGSFTGNVNADGPCIWTGAVPETLTINGNAVTWGTHADKLSTGFKLRTSSASYNASGTNNWVATYNGKPTVGGGTRAPALAQGNP